MIRWLRRVRRGARRFGRDESAVAAIEFAMVAPVFLFLVFAILETSILYVIATVLEGEVSFAARQIRTGQLQQQADPETAFRNALCANLQNVIDCNNVIIDVRNFSDFGSMTFPPFVDNKGKASGNVFEAGTANQIVLVRVAYQYHIVTPYLADILPPRGQDTVMLYAAAAFKNEPFQNAL